jgi:putative PIN family toxin of toxin-antitoxin system
VKAILDASVIVATIATKNPRSASRVVIEAVALGACDLVVINEIEAEYLEVIVRPKVKQAAPAKLDCKAFVMAITAVAERVEPESNVHVVEEDPDDDKYVAAALAGNVDVVVTFDRKHLLVLDTYQKIRFLTPGDFLEVLARTLD